MVDRGGSTGGSPDERKIKMRFSPRQLLVALGLCGGLVLLWTHVSLDASRLDYLFEVRGSGPRAPAEGGPGGATPCIPSRPWVPGPMPARLPWQERPGLPRVEARLDHPFVSSSALRVRSQRHLCPALTQISPSLPF